MVQRKKAKLSKPLTAVELELMQVIWDLGECTIRDVHAALPETRDLAYTSVATMMKILEQKGALLRGKTDRTHTYKSRVSREEYETASLRFLSEKVFKGDRSSMVMRLLDESDLTAEELATIRKLVDERLRS
jgi:predicted transcriptional regulator